MNLRVIDRLELNTFELPKTYIKYRVKTNQEMDNVLEYDADEEVSSVVECSKICFS